jgi:hypothetical protein
MLRHGGELATAWQLVPVAPFLFDTEHLRERRRAGHLATILDQADNGIKRVIKRQTKEEAMRTPSILVTALALAVGVVSAQAQGLTPGVSPGTSVSQGIGHHAAAASDKDSGNNEAKVKANDKAYNATLKNLPDKQFDPWHGMR